MNGSFGNADVNKLKSRMMFLMLPLFILVGFFVFLFGLSNRTMFCTYNGANNYNCQTNLQIFGFSLGTDNFSNITKATMASSRGSKGTTYQMQFVNQNGQNLQYTNTWTSMRSSVNKNITEVNRYFEAGKNFSYTFAREWFLIIFGLFFAGIPILILIVTIKATNNNTGFGNFDARKFIKKDLSKMSDEEVMAFIKQRDAMEK